MDIPFEIGLTEQFVVEVFRKIPSAVSFRHARIGIQGVDGLLPSGWTGEAMSLLSVEDIQAESPASIAIRFEFSHDIPGDYVSLSIAPYARCGPSGLLLLRSDIAVLASDNIEAMIIVIREWVENGPFVDQTINPVLMGKEYTTGIVGRGPAPNDHVFQPVLTFRRSSRKGGSATVRLRSILFANIYEYPDWLRAPGQEATGV